jgi:hypothetical protein
MSVNGGTNWDTVTISSAYTQVASAVRTLASSTVGFRMAVSGDVIEVDFTQNEATNVTSPIPTTTEPVTRNADVISLSGAVSGCIGQTEGTIYAEVDIRNFVAESRIFAISDGAIDNAVRLTFESGNVIRGRVRVGGINQVQITTSALTSGIYKIALAYKADDFAMYLNGTQIGTDTSGTVPACSQIFLGKIETSATTNQLGDRIRAAALYTTRLTDSELAALTQI